jgi:putative ABC transport system permease protein
MLRVTLRNLLARKLRLVMSAFAIVLGVAFVGGSLIFTDAMGGAFDDIIEGTTADVEIAYPGATDFDSVQDNRTIPASVVADLEQLPEVEEVYATNQLQSVFVVGENGKVVGGNGPPGLAFNYTGGRNLQGEPILTLVDGEYPDAPGEIALDVDTAEKAGYAIGDEVSLVTPGDPPTMTAELTGLVEFGNGGLVGATITIFETEYMQDTFFGGEDVYNAISLDGKEGVSQEQLREAAQSVLPDGIEARTGDAAVEQNKEDIDSAFLRYIRIFMLVFAGISLVVGAFLIINTFSILVAQRSRELALLRALGASRAQVVRSVLLEAVAVGLVGSTLGLALGVLLARAISALLGMFGLDLSSAEFPVHLSTVFWCYVLGLLVTVVAAVLPALRASRAAPMAALRDDVALPESTLRRRVVLGVFLVLGGIFSVIMGFVGEGSTGLTLIGLGLFLILVGVSLMAAFVARPVVSVFGVAYRRLFGSVGQIATQNSLRNPRRLAATSSALMIGVALVAMVSIFGSSASKSTEVNVQESLKAQVIVSNVVGQPFSVGVARTIRDVDGVQTVAQVQNAFPDVDGGFAFVAAVEPEAITQAVDIDVLEGSLFDLGPGTVAVDDEAADGKQLEVGDPVSMDFQGGEVKLRVAAIYERDAAIPANWLVTPETTEAGGLERLDSMLFVVTEPSADVAAVETDINEATKDLPTVTVKDPQGYADEQKEQINTFLYLIYALLGLSVVISILGVINTLGLSVIERTREVGLLRAVGLSRSQLRTLIRLESIVIAVFGALLGVVVGIAFGVSLVKALKDQGLTDLAIPWMLLVSFVVAAGVVGVLAAVFPGRRAGRLDVLKAIATE